MSKKPWNITSVESCGDGAILVSTPNGMRTYLTADDLAKINYSTSLHLADASSQFRLSDVMGMDVRLLLAIRTLRLGLIN